MKCRDCERSAPTRNEIRDRAIMWAASIEGDSSGADTRAAFACFGLLLMGELAVRCDPCATQRVMDGVSTVGAGAAR